MICPNKNTQEWRDLETKYGNQAIYVWRRQFAIPTTVRSAPIKTLSIPQPYIFSPTEKMGEILQDLKRRFKIDFDVINDPNLKFKGKYENVNGNKKVIINVAYATGDTPFHEYFHPFVRTMMSSDPEFFKELVEESKDLPIKDDEERVTTYLGKLAKRAVQPTLLTRFLEVVQRIIFDLTGKRVGLHASTKVRDLVNRLTTEEIDVQAENTLLEAYQAVEDKIGVTDNKTNFSVDALADLARLAQDLGLVTDDTSNTYKDPTGANEHRRATSFAATAFSYPYKGKSRTYSERQALELFQQEGKEIEGGTVRIEGRDYTYEEMVKLYDAINNTQAAYGKAVHAYLWAMVEQDSARQAAAMAEFEKYAKIYDPGFASVESSSSFSFLAEDWPTILRDVAGLQVPAEGRAPVIKGKEDRVLPELTITSDIMKDENGLPLAGTADVVVQHYNNEMSFLDYKAGDIYRNWDSSSFLKYGAAWGINDSRLSKASLEMALRAIMVKEKYPEIRFRDLKIIKVSKYGDHSAHLVDLASYLGIIGDYYKANNREVYDKLKSKGLLEVDNYLGTDTALVDVMYKIANKPLEEQRKLLQAEIDVIVLNPLYKNEMPPHVKAKLNLYTKALLELTKDKDMDLNSESADIAAFFGQFKNLSDVDNNKVKVFNNEYLRAREEARKEREAIFEKNKELLSKVVAEDAASRGISRKALYSILTGGLALSVATGNPLPILITAGLSYLIKYLNVSNRQYYSWLWRESADPGRPGFFLNTKDTHPITGAPLTKAQIEYRDFMRDTMHKVYSDTMAKPYSSTRKDRVLSTAEALGMPLTLPEDFMPRAPKTEYDLEKEVEVQKSLLGKMTEGTIGKARYWLKSHLTRYYDEMYKGSGDHAGITVKYFAHTGSPVVTQSAHTFDPDVAFRMFVGNMIHKKYFDSVFSLAQGVKSLIEEERNPDRTPKLANLAKWMDSTIQNVITKEAKPETITSKPIVIQPESYLGRIMGLEKPQVLAQEKVLAGLKMGISFAAMGWKVSGAVFNTAIITAVNGMQSTRPLFARLLGVPPDDVDGSDQPVRFGFAAYAEFVKDYLLGNKNNNKLWLMAKEFEWLPDNYDWYAKDDDLIRPTRPTLGKTAFMFHNFAETYGALTHLAILAKSVKYSDGNSKFTLWDAYKVEDGKLKWTKGSRGKKLTGAGVQEDLNELDFREIKALKRIYENMHGSYRDDEKAAIEATVLGQFLVQFRKYFFRYMKNLYGTPMLDTTSGQYKLVEDMKRPDGVPVWEWESQVMNGRLRMMVGGVMAVTNKQARAEMMNGVKDGSRREIARRKRIAELFNTFAWMMLVMMAIGLGDDDDEETYLDYRLNILLNDVSMGMTPKDALGVVQRPIVSAERWSKIGIAFTESTAALVTGKRTARGDIPGWKTLQGATPIIGNAKQITDLFENVPLESNGMLFGIVPYWGDERTR